MYTATLSQRELGQAGGAYLSNRGEYVKNKQAKTQCKSIFKDNANKNATFSGLWAEVINELEKTKYMPIVEKSVKIGYNGQVQSHANQSKKGEVSST